MTAVSGKEQTGLVVASEEDDGEEDEEDAEETDHWKGGVGTQHMVLVSAELNMPEALEEAHYRQGGAVH